MTNIKQNRAGVVSLLSMAAAHKGKMAFACAFSFATQLCAVAPFIILFLLVNRIAEKGVAQITAEQVWPLVLAAGACVVLRYVFFGISNTLAHLSAYAILFDLRLLLAETLPKLPLGFFNESASGQIKKVLLEDVEQMEIFIGHNLPEFMGSLLYLVIFSVVLFWIDWRLALASLCLLPIAFLAQSLTITRNKETRASYFTANERTNAAMVQYIQGMPIIKAFTRTRESFSGYAKSVSETAHYESTMCRCWALPMAIFSVALNANMLVLFPVGCGLYLSGAITLSTLVLFLLMGLGLGNALHQFMTLGMMFEHQTEGRKRIDMLLAQQPLFEKEPSISPEDNSILIDNVSFSYGEKQVLFDVSASLEPGRFLALVGPSGAGKSTFARLIPRFWDVTGGAISVGGSDIRDMAFDDLMAKTTFVFQDIFLFNDTIEANLRIGKPDATQKELEDAAKAARCHDFIMSLPNGYQHVVGDRGGVVSGGEKQRICIARALLKDAPILVMDEATAFIDPENEAEIQLALNALVKGKTLIVIAHRLSTITAADEILLIDKGKVAARGTHEFLLEENTLYARMWHAHMASQNWTLNAREVA